MNAFRGVMEWVGLVFDATGVLVIAGGVLMAAARLAAAVAAGAMDSRRFRQDFGGAIVLGLEFLVAGDIIRTVVVAPTLENVAVLAIIVVIRTVLSARPDDRSLTGARRCGVACLVLEFSSK